MRNPFTLSFGIKPTRYISRIAQTNEILECFREEVPYSHVFMISGVRGSGKTVLLTTLSAEFEKDKNWIVVDLNPSRDMLQSLAGKLAAKPAFHTKLVKGQFDFSILGLGITVEAGIPVTDIEAALEIILEQVKKQKKRILITIDEAVSNKHMRVFVSAFQMLMRKEYPIYLLMTGLYENIYHLQNDRSLTFLYRAPKIILEPLNLPAVRKSYLDVFHITGEEADRMTKLTKGYPFAFQVLGYLRWENREQELDDLLPAYDQYLDEYVYSKVWHELTEWDRRILYEMAVHNTRQVKELRELFGMSSQRFSGHRERLLRKGLVRSDQYGTLTLSLPRYDEFARIHYQLEDSLVL